MAILSDKDIKEYLKEGKIGIEPLKDEKQIHMHSNDSDINDQHERMPFHPILRASTSRV